MGYITKQNQDGTYRLIDGLSGMTVLCVGKSQPSYSAALLSGATLAEAGEGAYAPGDVLTFDGGEGDSFAQATVGRTCVVDAQIANAGTGGTPGNASFTGTTGQGEKFQVSGVIGDDGKLQAGSLAISFPGAYTTNPSNLNFAPIVGAGLTSGTVKVQMGVLDFAVTDPGDYTKVPDNPVHTVSPNGTGCTLNATWDFTYPSPVPFFILPGAHTPEDTGHVGSICFDEDYLYVCVAEDEWKRTSLTAVPAAGPQLMAKKPAAKKHAPAHHDDDEKVP